MFKVPSLLLLLALTQAANNQPKDLLCDICIDVVTDIDEWLTSDQTMDDIIHFVEGVSRRSLSQRTILNVDIFSAVPSSGSHRPHPGDSL